MRFALIAWNALIAVLTLAMAFGFDEKPSDNITPSDHALFVIFALLFGLTAWQLYKDLNR